MLAVLLMIAVAAGIAWPFVQKRLAASRAALGGDEVMADGPIVNARSVTTGAGVREELCPSCSRLNPPGRRLCVECGQQMPVTEMKKFFEGADKDELIREGVQSGLLLFGMILAMMLANFVPMAGKIAILMATIALLGWRVMRSIQG